MIVEFGEAKKKREKRQAKAANKEVKRRIIAPREKPVKIAIATPTSHHIEWETCGVFNELIAEGAIHPKYHFTMFQRQGSLLEKMRSGMAKECLKEGFDYVFWIDADMVFSIDDVYKLIERDVDIVSGLAVTRATQGWLTSDKEIRPVPFQRNKWGELELIFDYPYLEANEAERKFIDPLMEVDAVGSAFVCIKTKVFKDLEMPYYRKLPNPVNPEDDMGEDVSFCFKAKDAGYKIFLDQSVLLGHIGHYIYSMQDYYDCWAGDLKAKRKLEHEAKEAVYGNEQITNAAEANKLLDEYMEKKYGFKLEDAKG